MAYAVDEAQPEDRVVFPKEAVGEPAAKKREEVNADDEGVEDVLGGPGTLRLREVLQQGGDKEHREDVPHAVEAEAFAPLVADDEPNLARNHYLIAEPIKRGTRNSERGIESLNR